MSRRDTRRLEAQKLRAERLIAKVQRGGVFDAKTPEQLYRQVTTVAYQMHREGRLRDDELRDVIAFNKAVMFDQATQRFAAEAEQARLKAVRDSEARRAIEP